MSVRLCFVERRDPESTSVERVFRSISDVLATHGFTPTFERLRYANRLLGMVANLFSFRRPAADLYHIAGQIHYIIFRLPRKRTVLTIHDLGVLHARSGLRRYFVKKLLFQFPVSRAAYVTVISEFVKRELLENINCEPDKIVVVENPLTVEVDSHNRPFDETEPVLLLIGTSPNKNIERVIDAVSELPCKLRIVGRLSAKQREVLERSGVRFEDRAGISNEELVSEFQKVDIVLFCSTYEGFGLPIIEAQALSVPLITSDLSPMKETAGAGALLVDPFDVAAIRNAIAAMTSDPALRKDLVAAGHANIQRFDRVKIAACYGTLYKKIMENGESHVEVISYDV